MQKYISLFMATLSFGFLNSEVAKAEPSVNYGIHQDFVSTRALGMGNAFTAMANDPHTLFYNPAGLGMIKEPTINMFLRFGLSDSFLKLTDDIDKAGDNGTEKEKIDAISEIFAKNYGETYYGRMPSLGGFWVRPRWGIAAIPVDVETSLSLHQQVGPFLNVEAYNDTTLAYGYGRKVKWGKGTWYWGATFKAVYRVYANSALAAADMASDSKVVREDTAKEGLATDFNAGVLWTPKFESAKWQFISPTFAFVIRNVLDMGFKTNFNWVGENTGEPPKAQRRFDLGSKWELPQFWKFFKVRGLFDIRDLGHERITLMKSLHLGGELDWYVANWWKGAYRVGINQGYFTAGVTMKFIWFQLDLATWADEIGTKDTRRESRRYMLEMALDF